MTLFITKEYQISNRWNQLEKLRWQSFCLYLTKCLKISKVCCTAHFISVGLLDSFSDLFSSLVPVAVHQALASYDLRKTEIVNTEITKLRESTQELNGWVFFTLISDFLKNIVLLNRVLASLNLPAAIEVTDSTTGLPPSILEKANTVVSLGGISALKQMIEELPESLKRNQDILDETDR